MKNKFVALLLVLALCFSCVPAVFAAEEADEVLEPLGSPDMDGVSGSVGSLSWSLDQTGTTLTISGSGELSDSESAPWNDKAASITQVSLGSGITVIGTGMLTKLTKVTSLVLPASVTEVEVSALPSSLKYLYVNAGGELSFKGSVPGHIYYTGSHKDFLANVTGADTAIVHCNVKGAGSDLWNDGDCVFCENKTTSIKITDIDGNKASGKTLAYNGNADSKSITLTTVNKPAGHTDTVYWTITKGAEFATLVDHEDGTCTLTAVKPGSVTVKATAEKTSSKAPKSATVTIKIGSAADGLTVKESKTISKVSDNNYAAKVTVKKSVTLKTDVFCNSGKAISTKKNYEIVSIKDKNGSNVAPSLFGEYATISTSGVLKTKEVGVVTVKATAAMASEACQPVTFTVTVAPALKTAKLLDDAGKRVSKITIKPGETMSIADIEKMLTTTWGDGNDYLKNSTYTNITYSAKGTYGVTVENGMISAVNATAGKTDKVYVTVSAGSTTKKITLSVLVK